ncbi:MAG: hypothetical protein WBP13_10055 [Methylophilaceae bacterium]
MENFPLSVLKPRHAILSGEPHHASLQILLIPFFWKSELVDTSIQLDGIDLPSIHLSDLADRSFNFPLNPDENAIDGSIYLDSSHHPVDVSSIGFVRSRHDGLKVLIKGTYVFEFERLDQYSNTPFNLGISVSTCVV